jgi:hypothetical protein
MSNLSESENNAVIMKTEYLDNEQSDNSLEHYM